MTNAVSQPQPAPAPVSEPPETLREPAAPTSDTRTEFRRLTTIDEYDPLPNQPFRERVSDPKILERLLEWARTADDKASRFAILALGLTLFWLYYTLLVPVTASSHLQSLDRDLQSLDHLHTRLVAVQKQMRNVARVQPSRPSPTTQSLPFFIDVLLYRLAYDPRAAIRREDRREAIALRKDLIDLAVLVERYRSFHESHPSADTWPQSDGDPSELLSDLERAENVMFRLRDLNTQAANSEWLDAVERTLIEDGERVRLGATITGTLAPYEALVGTWAAPEYGQAIGSYRQIAARSSEPTPTTLRDLGTLQAKLRDLRSEADADLRIRRLRIPFTDVQADRSLVVAIGPIAVTILYHYILVYLVLARRIERFIERMWGDIAAGIASRLRPSDSLFRSFDDGSVIPSFVSTVRRPVRWFTHAALVTIPVVLVVAATIISLTGAAGLGVSVIALTVICGGYALVLAYGLWKLG